MTAFKPVIGFDDNLSSRLQEYAPTMYAIGKLRAARTPYDVNGNVINDANQILRPGLYVMELNSDSLNTYMKSGVVYLYHICADPDNSVKGGHIATSATANMNVRQIGYFQRSINNVPTDKIMTRVGTPLPPNMFNFTSTVDRLEQARSATYDLVFVKELGLWVHKVNGGLELAVLWSDWKEILKSEEDQLTLDDTITNGVGLQLGDHNTWKAIANLANAGSAGTVVVANTITSYSDDRYKYTVPNINVVNDAVTTISATASNASDIADSVSQGLYEHINNNHPVSVGTADYNNTGVVYTASEIYRISSIHAEHRYTVPTVNAVYSASSALNSYIKSVSSVLSSHIANHPGGGEPGGQEKELDDVIAPLIYSNNSLHLEFDSTNVYNGVKLSTTEISDVTTLIAKGMPATPGEIGAVKVTSEWQPVNHTYVTQGTKYSGYLDEFVVPSIDVVYYETSDIRTTLNDVSSVIASVSNLAALVSNNFGDLSTNVASVSDSLADLSSIITTVSGQVSTVSSVVSSISGTVSTISATVSSVSSVVSSVSGTVSSISSVISSISATVSSMSATVSTISTTMGSISSVVATVSSVLSNHINNTDIHGGGGGGGGVIQESVIAPLGHNTDSLYLNYDDTNSYVGVRLAKVESNLVAIGVPAAIGSFGVVNVASTITSYAHIQTSETYYVGYIDEYVVPNMNALYNASSGLNASIASVSNAIGSISAGYGLTSNDLADISAKINEVSNNVATVSTTVGTVSATVATVSENYASISNIVATVSAKVNAVSNTVATVSNNVDTVSTKVNNVSNAVANVSNTVGTVSATIATVSENYASLSSVVASVSNKVNTVSNSVATVSATVVTVSDNYATLSGIVATVSGKVNNVSNTTASVSSIVATVSNNVNTVSNTVASVSNVVGTVSATIATVSENYTALSGVVATVSAKVNSVSNITASVSSIVATVSDKVNTVSNTVASISNTVATVSDMTASVSATLHTHITDASIHGGGGGGITDATLPLWITGSTIKISSATSQSAGVVMFATSDEAIDNYTTTKAISPKMLAYAFDYFLSNHYW